MSLFSSTAPAAPSPLRLAIQSSKVLQQEEAAKDAGVRVTQCVALYLRDWLEATPGVILMDQASYDALLDDAMNPAISPHPQYSLALFTRLRPMDAAIHWTAQGGKLECGICRASGEHTREFPLGTSKDLAKLLDNLTDWICAELGLDRKTSPAAHWAANVNSEALETAYVLRFYHVVWYNPGTTKLKALRPFMNEARTNSMVAGTFLRCGSQISGKLLEEPAAPFIRLVSQVIPFVLGTDREDQVHQFLRANKYEKGILEDDLLAQVKSAGKSDADLALEQLTAPDKPAVGPALIKDNSMIADASVSTVARQCGALRCLGAMRSAKARPFFLQAAKGEDARIRAAVAFAWAQFEAPIGNDQLKSLAADRDPAVALTAAWALSSRGEKVANLADLARTVMKSDARSLTALQVLVGQRAAGDAPLLQALTVDPDPARRTLALSGLVGIGHLSAEQAIDWLHDPESSVVQAGTRAIPASADAAILPVLTSLANDPEFRLAEAVRARLASSFPSDPRQRRLRELGTEHPYVRGQIIEALAKEATPAALDDLESATENPDPHTRALALRRLASVAPQRAHRHLEKQIGDPNLWIRLHAASVAALCAQPSDAPFLKTAADVEKDEATRLYLLDAVARAQGKPLPEPQPAVNRLSSDRHTPFLCGHGPDAPNSPFQGYYDLNVHTDDAAKAAHAAGKIFFARANSTVTNPAQVLLSRPWRDRSWEGIDDEMMAALPWLDGIVIGEETMSLSRFSNWADGWRLFCRETGIDPNRIAGNQENLSAREKLAWWTFEQRVAVEGFNTLYDFIKLRYGKLRPGFAVCTFMPDQVGPNEFDRMWKFDVGAGYYYSANSRYRYSQIRRLKTLWPDRPVLWLVNGVATSPSGGGNVKYTAKMPATPIAKTSIQPYADAVCAYLAGADCGNFTGYLFIDKDMKDNSNAGGMYVFAEDFYPGSPTLSAAVKHAFRGVDEVYRTRAAIKELKPDVQIGKTGPADTTTLEEPNPKAKDRFTLQMEAEMKRMENGFLLDSRQARDCSRLLTDLPFPPHAHNVLLVGDITASKGALRFPNDYDFLDSIGKVTGQDLASYRLIAIADSEKALLSDELIANVTAWLKAQPGLLYIHGSVSTSAADRSPTLSDIDGPLKQSWPWAGEVSLVDKQYQVKGDHAVALFAEAGKPRLVFWRGAGARGGVLFDNSELPPAELREQLNRLFAQKQIGVNFAGPIGMEAGGVDALRAMVSCHAAPEQATLQGLDLLSGAVNPVLATSRSAAMVAQSFKGRFAATFNGVAVLSDQPLELAEPVPGGLRVRSRGLIQAAGASGAVTIQAEGNSPPVIPAGDAAVDWIAARQTPGIAEFAREGGGVVKYVRAAGELVIKDGAAVPK